MPIIPRNNGKIAVVMAGKDVSTTNEKLGTLQNELTRDNPNITTVVIDLGLAATSIADLFRRYSEYYDIIGTNLRTLERSLDNGDVVVKQIKKVADQVESVKFGLISKFGKVIGVVADGTGDGIKVLHAGVEKFVDASDYVAAKVKKSTIPSSPRSTHLGMF